MDIFRFTPWNWFSDDDSRKALPTQSMRGHTPVAQLHNDIDRLFQQAWEGFAAPDAAGKARMNLRPRLEVGGDETAYTVTVELPGVSPDDVKIELKDQTMIISGEKNCENKDDKDGVYHTERCYGAFRRVLALPDDVRAEDIKAEQKDGLLRISIPRKEPEKSMPRQIEIARA